MKENFSKLELCVIKGLVDSRLFSFDLELALDTSPYNQSYINSCISRLMIIRDKLDSLLCHAL